MQSLTYLMIEVSILSSMTSWLVWHCQVQNLLMPETDSYKGICGFMIDYSCFAIMICT